MPLPAVIFVSWHWCMSILPLNSKIYSFDRRFEFTLSSVYVTIVGNTQMKNNAQNRLLEDARWKID